MVTNLKQFTCKHKDKATKKLCNYKCISKCLMNKHITDAHFFDIVEYCILVVDKDGKTRQF